MYGCEWLGGWLGRCMDEYVWDHRQMDWWMGGGGE